MSRSRRKRDPKELALAVWDRAIPLLSSVFFIGILHSDEFYRYQPASHRAFYVNLVPALIVIVLTALRIWRMGEPEDGQGKRRNAYNYLAGCLALGFLIFQTWLPHPGPFYFLSGLLDRSPGQTIRLNTHQFTTRQYTARISDFEETFALVSFPETPEHKFEVNTPRLRMYAIAGRHAELEVVWHPGVLGLSWFDRPTFQVSPDLYKLELKDPKNRYRTLQDLKGRRLILVAVGTCIPATLQRALDGLREIEEAGRAIVVGTPVWSERCEGKAGAIVERLFELVCPDAWQYISSALNDGLPLQSLEVAVFEPSGDLLLREHLTSEERISKFEKEILSRRQ